MFNYVNLTNLNQDAELNSVYIYPVGYLRTDQKPSFAAVFLLIGAGQQSNLITHFLYLTAAEKL